MKAMAVKKPVPCTSRNSISIISTTVLTAPWPNANGAIQTTTQAMPVSASGRAPSRRPARRPGMAMTACDFIEIPLQTLRRMSRSRSCVPGQVCLRRRRQRQYACTSSGNQHVHPPHDRPRPARQARADPAGPQRAGRRRQGHLRPAHHRLAADAAAGARSRRGGDGDVASRPAQGRRVERGRFAGAGGRALVGTAGARRAAGEGLGRRRRGGTRASWCCSRTAA